MLTDRFGLTLSTTSVAARDAYIEGVDLLLTVYPGAATAFDRAIAADPGFALAYASEGEAYLLLYRTDRDPKWRDQAATAIVGGGGLMKNKNNKRTLLVLGFAIPALTYLLIGASTAQVRGSTVPAPSPTQKKVILKNLGMV